MQRKNFIRVMSWLLCVAMMVGMMPVIALAAEDGLVLHYDFESLANGTIVEDISGNGMAGEVMPRNSGVTTQKVEIYGQEKTAIVLAGGQPGDGQNYVEMPIGVLNDLDSVTISCWVYVNRSVGYGRIWDFGSNTTSYMYLLDNGANEGHVGYTAAITSSGWSNEQGPEKGSSLATRTWILTTVTFDGDTKTMTLYEDGVQVGDSVRTSTGLSVLNGSNQNWIGYGQFKDDMFNGMVADFRIYDYAMSADEVAGLFAIPDEERVDRDYASLSLGNTSALTQNLSLPKTGSAGSSITWKSDDESVITKEGVITRPQAGEANASTVLTATISSGEVTREKTFNITVLALPTDQQRVDADVAAINLGNLNAVTENLSLPSKGGEGSDITWVSDDHGYLSDSGKVTRPVGNPVTVKLTATVICGEAKATREFNVTIMPRYEKLDAVKAETVEVTTKVGIAPSLPAMVMTTFENGTTGMVKVTWPTNMDGANYAQEGTKTVTGKLVDHDVTVTANVTIASDVETPEAMAAMFDLADVSLDGDDTIYSQNMGRALEYLKVMDADRMLYNFRRTFGQDTKGARALTGWDEPTGLLRGHSTGHFMSALAQAYASTGDEDYKEKLDYMIEEMRALQLLSQGVASEFETACTPSSAAQSKWSTDPSTWGEGFISAYSPDQFALLEQYTPYATIWAPYYTMHKLLAGFLDSYVYAGNETGLDIAVDLGLWVHDRLSACTQEQRTRMWAMYIAGEYGGMNEVLARLYEITGDERLLETSLMFDNTVFFNGLAENEDTIQTRHANQHIPQIVGAIHEYAATGDPFYYNVAQHFWEMATARYAYSIGGVGTGESFKQPYKQGANINGNSSRGENCETCAAYNLLKLTRDLYIYDPDNAEYMDYYERTVLNQIAASQSHDSTNSMHNGVTYMLPIDPGQRRTYDSDYGGFTCCNGTGMENHVIYQIAAYAKTADTLYVNLFMPSTADWAEKGVSVKQETQFPSEDVKLTVTGSGEFKMKLRVPYWATEGYTVKVNGEVICTNPTPSSYVEIDRAWSDGDVVEINMPYTLHLDKTPDTVGGSVVASLMYGPMVMVARDTRSSYTAMNWYTVSLNDNNLKGAVTIEEPAGTGKVPHLVVEGLNFYPMYDAYNYRYHAYVKLMAAESILNPEYLQAAVAAVTGENAPSENAFAPEDWQAFQSALSAAQALLAQENVTQLALYEAEVALEEAAAKQNPSDFVAVAQITGVPTDALAGKALTLTATVEPANATNQAIAWSVKDAGETAAVLEGDVLTAAAPGTVVVTATIANGAAEAQDYTQDFTITVGAVDEDAIAKAVEAAQTAAAAAKAAAEEAKAAAEEAAAYVAEDMTAAEAAAAEAAIAEAAAEAAQAALEAAEAAADAETAQAAAAEAEEAAKAAAAAAVNAKANAAKQATVQKLEAAEAALKVIQEAAEAAEAAKAAAQAAQEAAEAAAASTAQDKTAAAAALEAAEAAKLAAENAATIAAEAREKAEAAEYDAAIAAAAAAASAAEAANSAAETAKAQAIAQSACEKAEDAQIAAEAAQEAAEDAAASAAQDKTAAEAARKAAAAAQLAAENAAAIAAEAREKAEAADYEAAVAAARAAASAAEAANSAAETAKAQAIAQDACEKAEIAKNAAEAAQDKADEAAAKGEVAAEEAVNAQKAADEAKKEAEKAEAAAKASADAANKSDAAAAEAAAEAAKNAAAIADALKEVADAQVEIAEAKERALAAAAESEAARKAAEEALAAAEAAALGAVKNFAVSQVVVIATAVPNVDLEVVMDGLTAIEAAESIAEVNEVLNDVMKALGLNADDDTNVTFEDMPAEDNWAYEGIAYCAENGLMEGVSNTSFDPEGVVSRAQLVTILYRAAGEPEVEFAGIFEDVEEGQWYSDAIEWAAANGIVLGKGDGKFDPMGVVTREQIATILYRYEGEPTVEGELDYPDADTVSDFAVNAMIWATSEGLINGVNSGDVTNLAPKADATRAQIATIIMRYLEA